MTEYYERNYGADADGNRGISFRTYDLGPSDCQEVRLKVLEQLIGYDECDFPEQVTITITASNGDDIDFDVDVKDYL